MAILAFPFWISVLRGAPKTSRLLAVGGLLQRTPSASKAGARSMQELPNTHSHLKQVMPQITGRRQTRSCWGTVTFAKLA